MNDKTDSQPRNEAVPATSVAFNLDEALARVDNDRELLVEIAGIFLQDVDFMMGEIASAVAGADAEGISRTAHRLKGSVLTFSSGPASEAALELEKIGRSGAVDGAPMVLVRLRSGVAELTASLAALVEEGPSQRNAA